jgi:hypothetical protein
MQYPCVWDFECLNLVWSDLDDIRASQKHQALRQQLHERFDQWLDALEHQLPSSRDIRQGHGRRKLIDFYALSWGVPRKPA